MKKILIGLAVLGGLYYAFGQKSPKVPKQIHSALPCSINGKMPRPLRKS